MPLSLLRGTISVSQNIFQLQSITKKLYATVNFVLYFLVQQHILMCFKNACIATCNDIEDVLKRDLLLLYEIRGFI